MAMVEPFKHLKLWRNLVKESIERLKHRTQRLKRAFPVPKVNHTCTTPSLMCNGAQSPARCKHVWQLSSALSTHRAS